MKNKNKKSISLYKDELIEQFSRIKKKEINERDNPDIKDTEIVSILMDSYEEVDG